MCVRVQCVLNIQKSSTTLLLLLLLPGVPYDNNNNNNTFRRIGPTRFEGQSLKKKKTRPQTTPRVAVFFETLNFVEATATAATCGPRRACSKPPPMRPAGWLLRHIRVSDEQGPISGRGGAQSTTSTDRPRVVVVDQQL